MNLGDGIGEPRKSGRNYRRDARGPMRAKDLKWTRFHGLLDSSCARDRDAGTYIATSRAMRMAT
jgi:hypothetical protein